MSPDLHFGSGFQERRSELRRNWLDPLAVAFRRFGYLGATLDPLGRLRPELHPDIVEASKQADPRRVAELRRAYCGSLGVEFGHLRDRERAMWLAAALECEGPTVDLERFYRQVLETEVLEAFLHRRYVGTKRYSIDGGAGLMPLLHEILAAGLSEEV